MVVKRCVSCHPHGTFIEKCFMDKIQHQLGRFKHCNSVHHINWMLCANQIIRSIGILPRPSKNIRSWSNCAWCLVILWFMGGLREAGNDVAEKMLNQGGAAGCSQLELWWLPGPL